jgi:hypothetical protein
MVIPNLVAQGGQKVMDAWDTIKSHVEGLANQAAPTLQAAGQSVASALTPTVSTDNPAPAEAPKTQKYRVKLDDGSQFDVTTEGGPPSEDELMAFLKANPSSAKKPERKPTAEEAQNQRILTDPSGAYTAGQVAVGAGKGALSTARGAAGLVLPKGWQEGLSAVRQRMGLPPVAEMSTPTNMAQTVGKTAEQAAEFMAPEALLGKVGQVSTGIKAVDMGAQALRAGAEAAGVSSLQQGSTQNALSTGALAAGTTAAVPFVMKALGSLGNATEGWVLNASKKNYNDGFRTPNVFRYGLGGSPEETFSKGNAKLADLGTQLKDLLKAHPATVDFAKVLQDAQAELTTPSALAKNVLKNNHIEAAFKELADDPAIAKALMQAPDLVSAQELKQGFGASGVWLRGLVDKDAEAKALVASTIYKHLNQSITDAAGAAGPEVRALNRQMSDIIPVVNAAIDRVPVDARRSVVTLSDLLALTSGNVAPALAGRFARSGTAANLMGSAPFVAGPTMRAAGPAAAAIKSYQVGPYRVEPQ